MADKAECGKTVEHPRHTYETIANTYEMCSGKPKEE